MFQFSQQPSEWTLLPPPLSLVPSLTRTRRHEDSWAWVGRLQKMLPALGKPSKTPAAAEPERLEKAKKQRRYFANKDPSSQSSGFSSGHRWIWELDYKESWAPKNWYFWNVVLGEDSWVPWTAKRSNQSILKDISPEYSLEGLMLKLKLQYFGHLMRRNRLIGKDPDAGKDWRQEKGTREDEMVGLHHRLDRHGF